MAFHSNESTCQKLCPTCNSIVHGKVMLNTDAQTQHINYHAQNPSQRVPCTYIEWEPHTCPIKEVKL